MSDTSESVPPAVEEINKETPADVIENKTDNDDIPIDDTKSEVDATEDNDVITDKVTIATTEGTEGTTIPSQLTRNNSMVIKFETTSELEHEVIPDVPQLKQLPMMLPPPELNEEEFADSVNKLSDFSRVLAGTMSSM